jgi:hypothetical protein
MKKALTMTVVGALLFTGSAVGILAVQGRLNHEGTRGIPVLSSFFPAPPDADANAGNGTDDAIPSTDGDKAHAPTDAPGIHSAGLGRETEPLPRRLENLASPTGEKGGDASTAKSTETAATPAVNDGAPANSDEPTADANRKPSNGPSDPQWERQREDIMGQGQYRRGRYFQFPTLESGLSVDQINQMLAEAREEKRLAAQERAELQKRKSDLDARELDIQDRYEQVLAKLQQVDRERAKLEQEIKDAQGTVTMIRQSELPRLKASARDLEALDPAKAAALIAKWWETQDSQLLALRLLTVMSEDVRTAILNAMPTAQSREVIEKRFRTFVEPKAAAPGR